VRIAFVGDVCVDADGSLWRDARLPDLHVELGVERIVANFEAVVGDQRDGVPAEDKICLSVAGSAVARLAEAGIDLVSVANNHAADFGADAFLRSVACLESAFGEQSVFGTLKRPTTGLAPGLDVLGACFPETNPRDTAGPDGPLLLDGAEGAVAEYTTAGRRLAVFAHWGEEQLGLAGSKQRARARTLIDDGAVQVVGCHSHVIGSGEDIGDATVMYGLGNFLFRPMFASGTRSLGSNRRSAAAVYEWDGTRLRYIHWMDCRFDGRMNLSIRRGRGRFPGGWWERLQLAVPETTGARLYDAALATRALRVGAVKVMTGVERPALRKLGTAVRLLAGRSRAGIGDRGADHRRG
jgi:hypothetical protein